MEPSDLVRQFVQHRDVLYGYIFALTRDHHAAEEILQELGMSILTEANRGTTPDSFMAWARGVARHRVADHYRRLGARRRHEARFEQFANAVDVAFAEQAPTPQDNQQQLQFLRECVERLTLRVRTMIDLRYRGEKSMDEIAAAMQWTAGSVKVAMSRARRTLGECVDRKLRSEEGSR